MKPKRSQYDLMHPLFDAMRRSKLKPNQRLVLLGLFRFMNGDGSCFPSYGALIDETGLTRPTIAKTIKELSELDWVKYESGDSTRSNRYQLNLSKLGLSEGEKIPLDLKGKSTGEEDLKQIHGRFHTKETAEAAGLKWDDH